ncbi:MAG: hypothetical protein ABI336_08575, partial [Humibacillus sp.]
SWAATSSFHAAPATADRRRAASVECPVADTLTPAYPVGKWALDALLPSSARFPTLSAGR